MPGTRRSQNAESKRQVRSSRLLAAAEWLLRISLGLTLLSAVGDRFGVWGAFGSRNVSWGDWGHFVKYCGVLNAFLPSGWAPLAWIATVAECLCAVGLISGLLLRFAAYGSFALFASFATAMTISLGVKAPLNFSVFVDAAAALLLAAIVDA